jgi:uncharacterized protein
MGAFDVNVADLLHRPGARRRERMSGYLGALNVMDTAVPPRADVVVDTLLEWVTEGVLATGTVDAPWHGRCRRCLEEVHGAVHVPFQELFEASPRDGESYPLRHDHIDLEPLAREALLLELPLAPLCREECHGLCGACGADLNVDPSHTHEEDRDPRWAALDQLRGNAVLGDGGDHGGKSE